MPSQKQRNNRRHLTTALLFMLPFSAMAGTLDGQFGLSGFVAYGETSVYGTDANVTLTVVSPEDKFFNNVTVAFELQAPAGYALSRHTMVLGKYLLCGCVLDYDRARVVDTLWANWGNSGNKTHLEEYNSLILQNYEVPLTYSHDSYIGKMVMPELSEGTHNFTIWVRAEQNYLSFGKVLWAAFSDTVTFTVVEPLPQTLVATMIIALSVVIVVSLGLGVYFLRRNRRRSEA
jgi:hypothetical protein